MADLLGGIPFGVDDVKVSARDAAGVLADDKVDIFGATAFSISTESDEQEARGDNVAARTTRSNKSATGSVGMLQHDPTILAVVGDGVTTTTGVTPAVVTKYSEPEKPGQKKYMLEAQSYDGVAATRLTVLNAQTVAGPNFDWSTDSYSEPGWDYKGTGFDVSGTRVLYTVEVFETGVAIPATNP